MKFIFALLASFIASAAANANPNVANRQICDIFGLLCKGGVDSEFCEGLGFQCQGKGKPPIGPDATCEANCASSHTRSRGAQFIAPDDIVLCPLASGPLSLKTLILENSTFDVYVEQELYGRELLKAYLSSNFKTVLELLNRYSVRDVPFASIELEHMSGAFGWTAKEGEERVEARASKGASETSRIMVRARH
ncbi:hypothetical protein C8R43DRAFT_1138423 [Mycena crocata]|nr:hypothetical protein C8R43DRAFT_1138423 [Mycena crocata]